MARILTTHVGSLPRPDDLLALAKQRERGETVDPAVWDATLAASVADVVRHQHDIGISIPGDGEYGKETGERVTFAPWWRYAYGRLSGVKPGAPLSQTSRVASTPDKPVLTSFGDRRDRVLFAAAYQDPDSGVMTSRDGGWRIPTATGPIAYTGHALVAADIAHFKAALAARGISTGFMSSLAPGICGRIGNEYYKSEEELIFACADAMREEYKAILDAGLWLQLDDPAIATNWDMITPEPTVAAYQAHARVRVEALNHAIRGLPRERIRFHLCWGSWHGPHVTDLPLRHLIDLLLAIDVRAYSFEAANVRHEHEWKVWRDVKLPDGKCLIPGMVSHATNVVEHPELVADRIERFARIVGPENVIASTDCGLGGRVHPDIAWAKLESLVAGAELAAKRL